MMRTRIVVRGIRWVYRALLGVAAVAMALFFWYYFEATHYQAEYERAFDRLEAERLQSGPNNSEPAAPGFSRGIPGGEAPNLDNLVGRLEIARIGLHVMVLKNADVASLRRGAGWIGRTAAPSEPGNMGIAGHRDTHFRPLKQVRKGDRIVLATVAGQHNEYRVAWIAVVDPTNVAVLDPTPAAALTLVTCYPFNYVGHAPRRFVVRANRIG